MVLKCTNFLYELISRRKRVECTIMFLGGDFS